MAETRWGCCERVLNCLRLLQNGDAVVAANTEEVYAVPNSRPAPRAQQQSDLLNIQQQLDTMTEVLAFYIKKTQQNWETSDCFSSRKLRYKTSSALCELFIYGVLNTDLQFHSRLLFSIVQKRCLCSQMFRQRMTGD